VSKAEAIKKFTILGNDFTEAGGEITPSLKLKRNVVSKNYATDIEALYGT
jgi:long-chain acyl-CoA synthetase